MGLDKKKSLVKRNKEYDFVVIMIAYDGDGSDKIMDKDGHDLGQEFDLNKLYNAAQAEKKLEKLHKLFIVNFTSNKEYLNDKAPIV